MSEHTLAETPTETTPSAAMAGTTLPDATGVTDPAALADHPAVEFRERSFTHGSPEHREHGTRGRAIVGVTDADGSVLLCVRDGGAHAILPNDVVDEHRTSTGRETDGSDPARPDPRPGRPLTRRQAGEGAPEW